MSGPTEPLRTARLVLRRWVPADREPFAAMNADPAVMEHFPSVLTREESDQTVGRILKHFDERGFGVWAVELPGVAPFIGFVGLMVPRFEAHFTPCVEVGWRIARAHWGHGYATEGARAALAYGWDVLGLLEIVAMTVPSNTRSLRVMGKLGLRRDPTEDFDHPLISPGHPLRRHVLFKIKRGGAYTPAA